MAFIIYPSIQEVLISAVDVTINVIQYHIPVFVSPCLEMDMGLCWALGVVCICKR